MSLCLGRVNAFLLRRPLSTMATGMPRRRKYAPIAHERGTLCRSATAEIPVILATAKGSEYDKVTGLDLGADDYLAKPFGMMEMVSRVKAVLRRTTPRQDQQVLQAGALSLNLGEHIVTVDGQRVTLTLKEFEVLRVMMEHVGQVFTRDRLLGEIWGYDFDGETRTVDVHMRTLRQKLGRCGDYIETVRGVGYRLEVEHP